LRQPDWRRVEQDLAWLERPGNHLLQLDNPRYPPLLRQIAYPPPLLFVHGDPDCLRAPQLAIVGTRNPTPLGRETAHHFAAHLANAGLVITSGLALGIDAAAHQGALAGGGPTIAVMGTSWIGFIPPGTGIWPTPSPSAARCYRNCPSARRRSPRTSPGAIA
jgi:DNA processing protein